MSLRTIVVSITLMAGCLIGSSAQALAALPRITDHPDNRTIDTGRPVTFSASFKTDSKAKLQWRFNRQSIRGATSASYVIPQVNSNNAGSYDLVVRNASGYVVTKAAVLNVPKAPRTLPEGFIIYADLTYRILKTTEVVDGAMVVGPNNTLTDPEFPEEQDAFVYQRINSTTATLKTYSKVYDADFGGFIKINETHKLTFTKLTSEGIRSAISSSSGVITLPPGYSPAKIPFTSKGKMSFEPEIIPSGGSGTVPAQPPGGGGIDISVVAPST